MKYTTNIPHIFIHLFEKEIKTLVRERKGKKRKENMKIYVFMIIDKNKGKTEKQRKEWNKIHVLFSSNI